MRRKLFILPVVLFALHTLSLRGGEALEKIYEQISESWEKVQTIRTRDFVSLDHKRDKNTLQFSGTGEVVGIKSGKTWKWHQTGDIQGKRRIDAKETSFNTKSIYVNDGASLFIFTDEDGKRLATKRASAPGTPILGGALFVEELRNNSDVTVSADDIHEGMPVFVLETKPKADSKTSKDLVTYYVSKSIGAVVKVITQSPDGASRMSEGIKEIKINEPVSADELKFEIPAGVKIEEVKLVDAPP